LIKKSENERIAGLPYEIKQYFESTFKKISMKNEFMQNSNKTTHTHVGLYSIVNRISVSSIPSATRRHSLIINDIPKELEVATDEHMLATVFGSLLNTVISHSENCCIRISAKLYGKVVLLHLIESYRLNSSAFHGNLRQVQQLAEKIGGTVSISSDRSQATSIVFSFLNNLPLAA
jgi:hypothetical protein